MTDDTDVLVKWRDYIEAAQSGGLEYPDECFCIEELAGEVRSQRETIRELRERLAAQEPDATLGRLVRGGATADMRTCNWTTGDERAERALWLAFLDEIEPLLAELDTYFKRPGRCVPVRFTELENDDADTRNCLDAE
jgi:hypothetical protein